jgi:hypothetical protein
MADAGGKGDSAPRWRGIALVVAGALALAALVYLLARRGGEVPDLPRPRFADAEVSEALRELAARAARATVTDDERALIGMIEELNLAETAEQVGPETAVQVEGMVKAVGEVARARAARNLERYLRLGDSLALEFDGALEAVLAGARREGLVRAMRSEAGAELKRIGGSFAARAVERGVITDSGEIDGPQLLPSVLFRVRWRALAGVDRREGLAPVEWLAHMDFVLAFSKPSSVEARLQAIGEISRLQPEFDALLARAVVLHEAGRDGDARALLDEAIDRGRSDESVADFVRSLSP